MPNQGELISWHDGDSTNLRRGQNVFFQKRVSESSEPVGDYDVIGGGFIRSTVYAEI